MRGATVQLDYKLHIGQVISIHAPRAGGDAGGTAMVQTFNISIHAPRAGGDTALNSLRIPWRLFQSTLPVRGATLTNDTATEAAVLFQSTPPVRGATLCPANYGCFLKAFQSTPPVRGATVMAALLRCPVVISIHAPRAGGDVNWCLPLRARAISIHAPVRGATLAWLAVMG